MPKKNKADITKVTEGTPGITEARRPPGFVQKYELRKWTYHVPMEPIPPEQIKETFTADVIVVGAGTSGKAAALTAAENGAKVIQIDRHTTYRYSGGHIGGIDSRLQKKAGVKNDIDEICLQLMRWGGNYPDQRWYRLWAEHSGATLDWVMDMTDPEGITTVLYQWPRPAWYDAKKEYYPNFPVTHFQTSAWSKGLDHSLALENLQKHALKRGVAIHYQTRAMQVVRRENGRVTGVIAMNKNGDYVLYNGRKAVVMCTGDYGNNPWMMQKYCPQGVAAALENNIYMTRNEDLRVAPEPLDTGDGYQMIMRIGGVMGLGPHAPMAHATAGPLGNAPFLRVNIDGERYENEDVTAQSIANSLNHQPFNKAWQIFDSKWEDEITRMGLGLGRFYTVTEMVRTNFETLSVKADTLEELAEKIGVPAKNFKATVARYNKMAEMGKDLDYAKNPMRLTPLNKPPYYAGATKQEFLVVLGGLNANLKQQPLDADRKPIPGLYLAGNMIGNRFAIDYPVMCAGLSHGLAYVTGRLVGKYAAAEKG
jgi:fumarate reductase flavoprotein subunit